MRSITEKIRATLAASVGLALLSFGAHATDIAGVKLGMSVAEAKAAFGKPAQMKVIPIYTNKVESGFAAWQGERLYDHRWSGPVDEFVAFKGQADSVWFVQKNQRLPKSARYTRQVLLEAVRKKFGKESFIKGEMGDKLGAIVVGWEFDQDGKQYFGQYSEGGRTITGAAIPTAPCRMFDLVSIGSNPTGGDNFLPEPMSITVPSEFKRSCNRAYYAEWTHDGDGLVEAVALRAIDSAAMLRAIDGKNASSEADARKRVQDQQSVSVRRPPSSQAIKAA